MVFFVFFCVFFREGGGGLAPGTNCQNKVLDNLSKAFANTVNISYLNICTDTSSTNLLKEIL